MAKTAEDPIVKAARQYQKIQEKAKTLLDRVEDRLLSGSAGTVYLKKMGHRALTDEDIQQIINALGSDADRQGVTEFTQAQQQVSERLKQNNRYIQLILKQTDVTYDQYRSRAKRPQLWNPEELITIMEALQRIGL